MRHLDRLVTLLTNALMSVGGVAVVLMMVHVSLDVALKYFLSSPIPMTTEMVSNYYMVAAVFLPLGYVERIDAQIEVDLVMRHVSPQISRAISRAIAALGALFMILLTWRAGELAVAKFHIGEISMGAATIPVWPSRFLLPIGSGLYALVLLIKVVRPADAVFVRQVEP